VADRLGQQFGNYRLVALLGQGGYAEVYLGQHVRLTLQAAIKVLHAHLTDQEADHFYQEAETIAKLTHPSIVRILDFDVQEGVPFLVMDYAPNGSLRQGFPRGSLVPLPQIVSSVKQVADALQYAHEQKFIHRDVKPENMLLGRREEVLLSDFGLAALAHSSASLSASGKGTVGTLAYMAPEQIEGHPRVASDQYALGVVVYEWLCGQRPFEGSVTEVMVKHLSMPPPSLRERVPMLPAEVEQVVLRGLAKEPQQRFDSVVDFAAALERASQVALSPTMRLASEQTPVGMAAASPPAAVGVLAGQAGTPTEATPSAEQAALPQLAMAPGPSQPPAVQVTPPSQAGEVVPAPDQVGPPKTVPTPVPEEVLLLPKPAIPHRRGFSRTTAVMLIGLAVLVIAGGILGSLSLLVHFGMIGTRNSTTTPVVRGGTWTDDLFRDPTSLIPNSESFGGPSGWVDQALYLPLFYGDAQGLFHPGAVTEVPTLQNGGISPDAKTWTFHMRPHLVWSDGQPYDARDVDYSWKLWRNPQFSVAWPVPSNLISSADISAESLTITFHLKQAYAPFLALWVGGASAPLPAHHFSRVAPEQILKSPENLNPKVTSGPFMMQESVPGDHYTLVRNPEYYRASEGLPYLDKVDFRIRDASDAILKDLQAGSIDSAWFLDVWNKDKGQEYQRLTHYTLTGSPTSSNFEAMYFDFHNTILASHLEVRLAMAKAIDQQALVDGALHGFGEPLCTDHGSAYHPGYQTFAPCPLFDLAAANKLLEDNGWVKGPDGVRTRGGQRLEFEYSAHIQGLVVPGQGRFGVEAIIQHNLRAIGIQLDIQNYPQQDTFFGTFLKGGKASPPTGAVAGRYDIAEWTTGFVYDPDDSSVLACDQIPPKGGNFTFYCNHTLDALYKQEQATVDAGVRQQIFNQIHQIYLTDLPFIVLYSDKEIGIVRNGTHNYLPSPFEGETVNIWEWWCDNGKC
jgi:peptide/nickel transport system substrate-binding protein